jgi:hypothetical protein
VHFHRQFVFLTQFGLLLLDQRGSRGEFAFGAEGAQVGDFAGKDLIGLGDTGNRELRSFAFSVVPIVGSVPRCEVMIGERIMSLRSMVTGVGRNAFTGPRRCRGCQGSPERRASSQWRRSIDDSENASSLKISMCMVSVSFYEAAAQATRMPRARRSALPAVMPVPSLAPQPRSLPFTTIGPRRITRAVVTSPPEASTAA